MTPITKEQAVQLAREAGMQEIENLDFRGSREAMTEPEGEAFDRVIALIENSFKLGRNQALEEARKLDWVEVMREGSLVTWGDAGTLGYRIVEKLESLKDNTP